MDVGYGMEEVNRFVSSQSSSSGVFFSALLPSAAPRLQLLFIHPVPPLAFLSSLSSLLPHLCVHMMEESVRSLTCSMKGGRLVWNCIGQRTERGVNGESAPERVIRTRSRGRKGC